MIEFVYYILLGLFGVGALLIALVNHKNPNTNAGQNWLKYSTYFIIVNLMMLSIVIQQAAFHYIAIVVVVVGLIEILMTLLTSRRFKTGLASLILFLPVALAFLKFSLFDKETILYTVFIIVIFDAFSQLTGQLLGKTKLASKISPNKTVEGLLGGYIAAMIASVLIKDLLHLLTFPSMMMAFGIASFGFVGDLLASWGKRRFGIKDFSGFLPGHGGVLDRFDSLLFASVFVVFYEIIFL